MAPPKDSKPTQDATVQLKAGAGKAEVAPGAGTTPAAGLAAAPVDVGSEPGLRPPVLTPSDGAPVDPMVGQVVAGRYRLIAPLATGGMGSVYRAEQLTLNRQVALKLMTQPSAELIERFRREAVALSEVSHPAIVEILDFATYGEGDQVRGCLVMAFIDGKDLGDYLYEQPSERLDPREVRILMLPIVSALVELHVNGILHRDIKPDNIVRFVRADGRAGVKLVDFGIARRQVDQGMTASGYVLGTPPYLPPETMLGEKHTPLSDIYALGATMFELLTGVPPYGNGSAAEIIQAALATEVAFPSELAPTAIGLLLKEMLNRLPTQRPDAMQVLQRLETMRDPGAVAPPDPDRHRPTRPLTPLTESDQGAGAGASARVVTPEQDTVRVVVGGSAAPGTAASAAAGAGGPLGRLPSTSRDLPALDERPRVPGSHMAVMAPASAPFAPAASRLPTLLLGLGLGALLGAGIVGLVMALI